MSGRKIQISKLVNPSSQASRIGELRVKLSEVVNAMSDYSAFDEEISILQGAKRSLMEVEMNMRKKIRDNSRM